MKETIFYKIIIIFCILGIFLIGLFYFFNTDSGFTQLYFENPSELPNILKIGESYSFNFIIENNYISKKEYSYFVLLLVDGEEKILSEGLIKLESEEYATFNVPFTIVNEFYSGEILVKLEEKEISFRVEQE
ncbi:hypothetical protein HOK68_00555 [Candidatus Woesearchaeota archaeon]|jgi:hypothetical protein|nr:hypothetical protein [archaeon]MBT6505252.1 hypothetical protein [Candidatus Woesearchaeota archaeon]MBT7296258.1 hypothetical protein [Candidatus Woesearchaeota archaeon]